MNELTKEEVLHIAKLARIKLSEAEVGAYQKTLAQLMSEVELAPQVDDLENILVAPTSNQNCYFSGGQDFELNNQLLDNAPHQEGPYIEVERVVND